jgi:hypothetical protein
LSNKLNISRKGNSERGRNRIREIGVHRVHAAIQGGFLARALKGHSEELAEEVQVRSLSLLQAIDAQNNVEGTLAKLNESLARGWFLHWAGKKDNV